MLSAIVSKPAIYGFLRIGLPKFPEPVDDLTVPILVLAGAGLVYGSLLAFRAPDLRGIVAYSSMAQMGLIVLGVFALNDLGIDGAVLQSVAHALISASMFLLVGMVERRCGTGEARRARRHGPRAPPPRDDADLRRDHRARSAGSATFAGEFLIMAGVYEEGWGYAAIVALGIVLAAMYTLRLISAVLHVRPGRAVRDEALDLRPGELALVLPLVACLLVLSAWPALVARLVPGRPAGAVIAEGFHDRDAVGRLVRAVTDARAPRRSGRRALMAAVLLPRPGCGRASATGRLRGVRGRRGHRRARLRREPGGMLIDESLTRDRLAALTQVILAVTGGRRPRRLGRAPSGRTWRVLRAARDRGAGMVFFVGAGNLMTLFLGLEWFSLCLYVLVAFDTDRAASLEAGLKYLIVGGFGSAVLLFGSAFVYGATGEIGFSQIAAAAAEDDAFLLAGLAMILAGLAFKVSAAPFHMWTPDVYQGSPTSVTAFMSAATKTAAMVVALACS